ncbi:MAG: hypothetical protein ACI9CE_001643 [Flavobacterium sp.]|jgi:hypothetical protein
MVFLRWLFALTSPVLLTALALLLARTASITSNSRCADINLISNLCVESWHTNALDAIIYLTMLILGAGFVLLPAIIAPRFKKIVAVIGFILVLMLPAYSYYRVGWGDLVLPLILTLVAAGTSVLLVWWKVGSRK